MGSFLDSESVALRFWVLITGIAGLGAAIGAYRKPLSPHKTLYCNSSETASAPFARMYGTWLLTSTVIRVAFFLAKSRSPSQPIFWLAFATYIIALFHFVTEIFIFRSAALLPGGFMPLLVAGFSVLWLTLVFLLSSPQPAINGIQPF